MATHRSPRRFIAPLASIVLALGMAACSDAKAAPASPPTTVVVAGQPIEAPTAVIDPAPVVTDAN